MRWWCRGTLAVLSLSLVAASDKSKTPQMPLPTLGETIEVSIVNVDVFVTDKSGKRIHGLTKDDFEIFENGVKQPLTNFAEYATSNDPLPEAKQAAVPGEGTLQRRTVVVFVERFRLPGTKATAIVDSMKKLLHDTIRPGDAATIVTWYRGRLETLQAYTDDLGALDRALDAVQSQNTVATRDEYNETRVNAQDVEDFELEGQAFAQESGATDAAIALMQVGAEEMKGMAGRSDALRARADLQLKVRTINALMRSMAGFDGKRVLLLATHRLSKIAGAEFYWANGVAENLDGLDRMELDTSAIIRSLHETANANGVSIYPMFPEGLGSSAAPVTAAGRFQPGGSSAFEYFIQNNEVPVLKELAARTGGTPAWGSSEVVDLLGSVRDDFEMYYSLAYRTTPRSKDTARAVEVRLKDPRLRIRSRREVIEKSDVTRMEDHVLSSLFRTDAGATLPFSVQVGTPRGKKLRIPVTIRVPISALTILPNGPNQSGGFSVYVAWGAKVGGISDATHERQLFHIPNADVARAKKSFFTYDFEIAADRRTERISVGVVDEISRDYGIRVYRLQPDAQAVLQPVKRQ